MPREADIGRTDGLNNLAVALQLLGRVDQSLQYVEDAIRRCEAEKDFGPRFVELARCVYRSNDRRAALKRQIDLTLGSQLLEEKSYVDYE